MEKLKKIVAKLKAGFAKKALLEFVELYRILGAYRKRVLRHTFLILVTAVLSVSMTMCTKNMVEYVLAFDWGNLAKIVILYVLLGVGNDGLSAAANLMAGRIRARVKQELADKTYFKIMRADWETVIQHHSGDLMTRMQEDLHTVACSTTGWVPTLLYQSVRFFVAFAVIVFYDYTLLLMAAIIAPVLALSSRVFLGRLYESNRKEREISSQVMSVYKESFHHLQSIKGFGLVRLFHSRMAGLLKQREAVDIEVNKNDVASWLIMYASSQLAALLCGGWALYRIYKGALSFGALALLVMMAGNVSTAVKTIMQQIPEALRSISASERLRIILSLPEEQLDYEEVYQQMLVDAGDTGASVKVENLNFAYANGTEVLKNVNYEVNTGEIVALVGPSGEGKTTMLRILLGIVRTENPPMLDVNGTKMPVSPAARRLMAYVPQGNTVLNGTIADNLRMFNQNATDEEIITALKEACAYEFVEKLPGGIYHNIGESGIGFSEGQNQRLAIARALMCKTPILLLDEATSALDVATERRVLANLMKGVQKRTCILTTHRPSVLSMCDRVYRIANKQVREIGEEEIQQVMNEF